MSNNRGRLDEVFVLADAGPLGFLSIADMVMPMLIFYYVNFR